MNEQQLPTATNGGDQTTTQSPQTSAGAANNNNTNSSQVQPGTATDLLKSSSGLLLSPTTVTTVNLAPVTTNASTKAITDPKPASHDVNIGLLSVGIIFAVVAIGLFVFVARSAKNTTEDY
jgi:hypothetical protein